MIEEIFLAGGCLWGVQEFIKHIPGVCYTEAGRANGTSYSTQSEYDGYAECVRIRFDSACLSLRQLLDHFFEIIDPYSINQQGPDIGLKYRTGIYSQYPSHLNSVRAFIQDRKDAERITVEVLPLINFVRSDDEHQHRLTQNPEDHALCHIPWSLLHKYKSA